MNKNKIKVLILVIVSLILVTISFTSLSIAESDTESKNQEEVAEENKGSEDLTEETNEADQKEESDEEIDTEKDTENKEESEEAVEEKIEEALETEEKDENKEAEILLTAEESIKYKVTFNLNGGEGEINDQEIEKGNKAIRPEAPVRYGYTFEGWYLGEDKWDFETEINRDYELVAHWEEVKEETVYKVYITTDIGGAYKSLPLDRDLIPMIAGKYPYEEERASLEYLYFKEDSNKFYEDKELNKEATGITLGKYSNQNHMGYVVNDLESAITIIKEDGSINNEVLNDGSLKEFLGGSYHDFGVIPWYTKTIYTVTIDDKNGEKREVYYVPYASFNGDALVSESYENVRGAFYKEKSEAGDEYKYSNIVKDGELKPQKEGYIFKGYYTNENGMGKKVIDEDGNILLKAYECTENGQGDCNLYANYEAENKAKISVSYYAINDFYTSNPIKNVSVITTKYYSYGQSINHVALPEYQDKMYHYTPKCWAIYTSVDNSLSYTYDNATDKYLIPAEKITEVEKDKGILDYQVDEWNAQINNKEIKLYPVYQRQPIYYHVIFKAGGEIISEKQGTYAQAEALINSYPVYSKEGYTFKGYTNSVDGVKKPETPNKEILEKAYEKWLKKGNTKEVITIEYEVVLEKIEEKEETHTVKFVDYNNAVISEKTYKHGETINIPGNPTRSGYTFTGWSPVINTVCTEDIVYKASYKLDPVKYTVTFKNFDGSVIDKREYNPNENIIIPANPQRAGYTFKGWMPEVNEKVTGNAVYVASYNINPKPAKIATPSPVKEEKVVETPAKVTTENKVSPSISPSATPTKTPAKENVKKNSTVKKEEEIKEPVLEVEEETATPIISPTPVKEEIKESPKKKVEIPEITKEPEKIEEEPKKEKINIPEPVVKAVTSTVVAGTVGAALVATGSFNYLYMLVFCFFFRKKKIKFHGILTDEENRFIELRNVSDDEDYELLQDVIDRNHNLTDMVEEIYRLEERTYLPSNTKMEISYEEDGEYKTITKEANEEDLFKELEKHEDQEVNVRIYCTRARIDIELIFKL